MQWRYHELRGKHVRSRDGHDLGPVADLVAERQGDALRVEALLVGRGAVIRRIGFKTIRFGAPPALRIPWRNVQQIDDEIHLSVNREQLNTAPAAPDQKRQKPRHNP